MKKIKIIFAGFFTTFLVIPCFLLSQSTPQKQSVRKSFIWQYQIPESETFGPMDVSVSGEYWFTRESTNGPLDLVIIQYKFTNMKYYPTFGTLRFKKNGIIYKQNAMHYLDGLAGQGFDEVKITSLDIKMTVDGARSREEFNMNSNFTSNYNIAKVDKNAGLDGLNLNLAGSRLTKLYHDNSWALVGRIDNLEKLTVKRSQYKQLIESADKSFREKNWVAAESAYNQANKLFPEEVKPINQLKEIQKLKDADKKKAEDAAKVAADNKKLEAVAKNTTDKKNTEDIAKNSTNNNKSGTQTSAISKTPQSNGSLPTNSKDRSNLPQFAKDNTGKYYEKDANNNYHEVSYNQYQEGKNNLLQQNQVKAQEKINAQNEQIIKSLEKKAQAQEDALLKNMNSDPVISGEKWANIQQSYYAAEAVSNARGSIENNSKLKGNYTSIEEIEAEFNQKYNSINSDVETLKTAKNQKLQSDYNNTFYDSDEKGKAIGQLAVGIGNLINEASAASEARKAKEKLQEQRKKEIAQIEEMKKAAIIDIRTKLLSQFVDGGLPLSSHKINVDEVYFFTYAFDKNTISAEHPVIYISNSFPIAKYGDGTWPFKSTLINNVSKLSVAGTLTIMGYYTTSELAADMRNSLKNLSEKCGFVVKDISYKGSKASQTNTEKTDFWGNDMKKNTQNTKDKESNEEADFWGNDLKKNIQNTKEKKSNEETDFWGNPVKVSTKDKLINENKPIKPEPKKGN